MFIIYYVKMTSPIGHNPIILYWYTKKKTWESTCYSSHVLRLWHRPDSWTSNAEAHACMYICSYKHRAYISFCNMKQYYIPMSVLCCLVLDYQFETARFQHVKHKAQVTLFPIYRSPPSSVPPASGASVWRRCKVTNKNPNRQAIRGEFYYY